MEEIKEISYKEIDMIINAIMKVANNIREYDIPLSCVNFNNCGHYYEFKTNTFLTRFHTKLMNCYNDRYAFNKEDTIDNPISSHMNFIKEILDKLEEHNKVLIIQNEEEEVKRKIQYDIQVEKELKKQLKIQEDNKLRMEQERMEKEEERMRLLMEEEKKIQKLKDYALKIRLKKTEQIPCPNCGQLKSRGNMATHMTMNVCKNFGKEIEVRKKGYFTCEYCGKEERNTNKQNHLATKKCMRTRAIDC
jgi:predicted RNA-binding Zn-ribbon protein involved in translation (DUF1610 family)